MCHYTTHTPKCNAFYMSQSQPSHISSHKIIFCFTLRSKKATGCKLLLNNPSTEKLAKPAVIVSLPLDDNFIDKTDF